MMAVNAVLGIFVPIALAWWMVKKYQVKPKTIVIGALVFIVFALGLESVLHQLVLKGPHGPAILANTWYYALYGGLAAGIFEETGRFLAMKFLLKSEPTQARTAVAYGIGHGGAEMILVFGLTMISNIVVAAMINSGQADTLLASAPAEAQQQMQAQFSQLEAAGAGSYLLGLWERVSALILQLGLSIIVWTAVRRGGKWLWLFPAAILLHFLVDACTVVLAKSVSMLAVETIVFCLALAVGAIGWMLAKKL
jgi:uncharacterized membrane protein YhfC